MDKRIDDINKKFHINFEEKGEQKYTYFLPENNWITIDLKTETVDSKNWYGGENMNGPWDIQPRNEQGLEGLIHNLISINNGNKGDWKPPF